MVTWVGKQLPSHYVPAAVWAAHNLQNLTTSHSAQRTKAFCARLYRSLSSTHKPRTGNIIWGAQLLYITYQLSLGDYKKSFHQNLEAYMKWRENANIVALALFRMLFE